MKRKNIIYAIGLSAALVASLSSCDSYLDEQPDNRTEIDTEDKIVALLTSAYSQSGSYITMNECMSDNWDDMGSTYNNYTERFLDQSYAWEDITEETNDSPQLFWTDTYRTIAAANHALQAIEEMGGATTTTLKECKGEALICRAYGHFLLANEFCMAYDPSTASTDLGIPYALKPETTVKPDYVRGTLAEVYENIDKDIQEALPLVGDGHLTIPKYHFNTQAAYAFATRFYLFYQKWDKVVEYAGKCLGSNPAAQLRDWDAMESWGVTSDIDPRTIAYVDETANCNLLITSAVASSALSNYNYRFWTKYSHDKYLSQSECVMAPNLWGSSDNLKCAPMVFQGSGMDRCMIAKMYYAFYETDAVSKTGYYMTTSVPFKADAVLLDRAEAYIMLKQYDKACTDMTTWMKNFVNTDLTLNTDTVASFYNSLAYYTWEKPTLKKHLNPQFAIDAEGSVQESMLQCLLNFKRMEDVHEGARWWDVKRYGIEVDHRVMNSSGEPERLSGTLKARDPRLAIQLPTSVVQAGLEANPR